MKILTFSDLHGKFTARASQTIREQNPDWIVLAGDMLPDFSMLGGKASRLEAQRLYWNRIGPNFHAPGTPTVYVLGNHEIEGFDAPEQEIPQNLVGRVLRLEGIPSEWGAFGYSREMTPADLKTDFDRALLTAPAPWIVVSHVPPHGTLDEPVPGQHIGHRPLAQFLERPEGASVQLVLCGHVHEGFGVARLGGALILNLATGFALVDLAKTGPKLLMMHRFEDLLGEAAFDF